MSEFLGMIAFVHRKNSPKPNGGPPLVEGKACHDVTHPPLLVTEEVCFFH